jgi:hypothetical protein
MNGGVVWQSKHSFRGLTCSLRQERVLSDAGIGGLHGARSPCGSLIAAASAFAAAIRRSYCVFHPAGGGRPSITSHPHPSFLPPGAFALHGTRYESLAVAPRRAGGNGIGLHAECRTHLQSGRSREPVHDAWIHPSADPGLLIRPRPRRSRAAARSPTRSRRPRWSPAAAWRSTQPR